MLAYWEADGTFQASVEQRDAGENGANEFVFYDGPPFANGLPHYGHLLTGYVKDVVPRYQTMRGKRVERRFGWDTHGLPAELEAMRQLGIKTTDEIHELGIEKFNDACRAVGAEVHRRVARLRHPPGALGRLRQRLQDAQPRLHGVGHLGVQAAPRQGPGLRGLPGAALLLERRDAAVQPRAADGRRRLPEAPGPGRHRRRPPGTHRRRSRAPGARLDDDAVDPAGNLAVMVGPDIDYVVVESDRTGTRAVPRSPRPGWRRTPASSARSPTVVVAAAQGRDLLGRTYTPPFGYYVGHENAFRVVAGRLRHDHRRHRAGAHRRRLR